MVLFLFGVQFTLRMPCLSHWMRFLCSDIWIAYLLTKLKWYLDQVLSIDSCSGYDKVETCDCLVSEVIPPKYLLLKSGQRAFNVLFQSSLSSLDTQQKVTEASRVQVMNHGNLCFLPLFSTFCAYSIFPVKGSDWSQHVGQCLYTHLHRDGGGIYNLSIISYSQWLLCASPQWCGVHEDNG